MPCFIMSTFPCACGVIRSQGPGQRSQSRFSWQTFSIWQTPICISVVLIFKGQINGAEYCTSRTGLITIEGSCAVGYSSSKEAMWEPGQIEKYFPFMVFCPHKVCIRQHRLLWVSLASMLCLHSKLI